MNVDLKVTDLIRVYDNVIPSDQCDMMIDWYESNPSLRQEGCVYDGTAGTAVRDDSVKICKESSVPHERNDILDLISQSTFNVYQKAFEDGMPFPDPIASPLCINGYTIRKYKKNYPNKKIIVTGCASQIDPSKFKSMNAPLSSELGIFVFYH